MKTFENDNFDIKEYLSKNKIDFKSYSDINKIIAEYNSEMN